MSTNFTNSDTWNVKPKIGIQRREPKIFEPTTSTVTSSARDIPYMTGAFPISE